MEETSIPEIIKEIRKAKQLTQTELAILLGISWRAVSNYERDKSAPLPIIKEKILAMYKALK